MKRQLLSAQISLIFIFTNIICHALFLHNIITFNQQSTVVSNYFNSTSCHNTPDSLPNQPNIPANMTSFSSHICSCLTINIKTNLLHPNSTDYYSFDYSKVFLTPSADNSYLYMWHTHNIYDCSHLHSFNIYQTHCLLFPKLPTICHNYTFHNFKTIKYTKARIPYYPNSISCFNIDIICCGDIELNPGPVTSKTNCHSCDICTKKLPRLLKYLLVKLALDLST